MKTKLPKTINLVITEADRQNAENFGDDCNCLIATAIRRKGYENVHECVSDCWIEGVCYKHKYLGVGEVKRISTAVEKPFYLPSVVGLKIKLTRVDPQ